MQRRRRLRAALRERREPFSGPWQGANSRIVAALKTGVGDPDGNGKRNLTSLSGQSAFARA